MNIETRHFGTVDVSPQEVIEFSRGLPGFEDVRQFVLLGQPGAETPFMWLQSVDAPHLAFVVIDPKTVDAEYAFDMDDADAAVLEIIDPEHVLVFGIVVVPEDIKKMTVNMKAPLIINPESRKGMQVVLTQERYQVRYPLYDDLKKAGW